MTPPAAPLVSMLPTYEGAHVVVLTPSTQAHRVATHWAHLVRALEIPVAHSFCLRMDYAVDRNREGLVEQAMQVPGATHVLWWDDDVWPQPDAVVRLLSHRYPAVSGVYLDRAGRIVAGDFHDDQPMQLDRPARPPGPGRTYFTDVVGFGFCLVDLRIFRAMPRPWFEYDPRFSEDFRFCWHMKRQLGIRVLVDGSVPLGHESAVIVQPDGQIRYPWGMLGGRLVKGAG